MSHDARRIVGINRDDSVVMKFGEFEEEEIGICPFFFRVLEFKKKKENSEKYGIKRELIFTYSLSWKECGKNGCLLKYIRDG